MKITAIANLSANGKVLLANNTNHKSPKAGEEFFIEKAIQTGNLVIGRKTFEVIKELLGGNENLEYIFPGVTIVIISSDEDLTKKFKIFSNPRDVIEYLRDKGFDEIIIGGGTRLYNTFLEAKLLTDLYFNLTPVITGAGGVIGKDQDFFSTFKLVETRLLDGGIVQIHLSDR